MARYLAVRDEEAFRQLMLRHGPMVFCTCLRMLKQRQDAEDAFQAVFVTLAGYGRALRRVRSLGGWLHNVSVRVCHGVLRANRRREQHLRESYQQGSERASGGPELKLLLDEELTALPAKYREVLILCDLEGHTREEAARKLGSSAGTVATWLARGRKQLRQRLIKRGLTLGAGGLAAELSRLAEAAPEISSELAQHTIRHAQLFVAGKSAAALPSAARIESLAQGVIHTMFLTKLSTPVCIIALAAALVLGASPVSKLIGLTSSVRAADIPLYEDFNDRSATDGSPAAWRPFAEVGSADGTFDASSGDFVLTPASGANTLTALLDPPVDLPNLSIRTQFRNSGILEQSVHGTGVLVRGDAATFSALDCGIDNSGELYINYQGPYTQLGGALTDLRPLEEDVVLQVDVFGTLVSVFAWRPGEPKPDQPQLQAFSDHRASGSIGIYYNPPDIANGTATFRYVQVAREPIPEPPTAALGSLGFIALAGFLFRTRLKRAGSLRCGASRSGFA